MYAPDSDFRAPRMWFLPYERIAFDSRRSPDDLVAALARVTRPPPMEFRLVRQRPTATFYGEVSKERLYFRRAIYGQNSFAPFVFGRIVPTALGARIEAVMRPHSVVIAFLAVFTAVLVPAAVVAATEFFQRGVLDQFGWVPVFMLVVLYAGCMLGYVPEARRMKRLLRDFTHPCSSGDLS